MFIYLLTLLLTSSVSVNNIKDLTDAGSASRIWAADLTAAICSVSSGTHTKTRKGLTN